MGGNKSFLAQLFLCALATATAFALILLSPTPVDAPLIPGAQLTEVTMSVKVKEWVQREWKRPDIDLFQDPGDFYEISNLLPDLANPGRLKRGPSWSAATDWPATFSYARGGFYDEANNRRVFVGSGNPGAGVYLRSIYYNSSWSASGPYTLTTATSGLGGLTGRNVVYWGGYLYVIGYDGHVYRGTDYTTTLTDFYATGDARILAPYGDRMYLVVEDGQIYRLNDARDAFESFYDPVTALDIRYLAAFRHYLVLVGAGDDGTVTIYRLPDISPTTLHTLAVLPADAQLPSPVYASSYGCLFAVHDDKLFMSLGKYRDNSSGNYETHIYAFNGTWVEHIGYALGPAPTAFLHWKGRLLLHHYDTGKHYFLVLIGERFTDLMEVDLEGTCEPPALSLGAELVIFDASGGRRFYRAGAAGYADGYLITSRLDMGHPGKEKRLEKITALLDGAADEFDVILKYRTDDASSWTTALTQENSKRISIGDLGVSFYTLQLRIDFDDDTGANQDIGLHAVSVIYSVDE